MILKSAPLEGEPGVQQKHTILNDPLPPDEQADNIQDPPEHLQEQQPEKEPDATSQQNVPQGFSLLIFLIESPKNCTL